MKLHTGIAAALLAVAVLTGTSVAASAEARKVVIATEGSYAPWNFTEADGTLVGYEIDVASEMCKRANLDCTMSAQPWDGIIPSLNAKKFDAIMSGMNSTAKRREAIAFSRSYAEAPNGIGVSLEGPLANLPGKGQRFNIVTEREEFLKVLEQLKPLLQGKVVGIQTASIHATFLEDYLKGVVTVQEYKSTEQRDLDLSAGRLDAIFTSLSSMEATFKKPEFKTYGNVGPLLAGGVFGDGVSVGLRKDDTELKAAFDKAINEMLADGTMKALSEKWFKTDYTPKK